MEIVTEGEAVTIHKSVELYVCPTSLWSIAEVMWLAGLLEGEGCFTFATLQGRKVPRIKVSMCDADVIERVALMWNRSANLSPRQLPCRDLWNVTIAGHPALDVVRVVRPHMGKRRTARIDDLLASEYARSAARNVRTHLCRNGHDLNLRGRKASGCCRECARLAQQRRRRRG